MIKQVLITSLMLGVVSASAAHAQGQRGRGHSGKEILIPNPTVADASDVSYSQELADRVRNRMNFRHRRTIDTFQTETICEALTNSGFECDAQLDPIMISQLAGPQVLNADAYWIWRLSRDGEAPVASVRMVDSGRSGVSGTLSVTGEAGQDARSFADDIVDAASGHMDAAGDARRCYEERDSQNYESAANRAYSAFEDFPNHPSSANCLATVFEADGAPADSVIKALEMVVAGDSLLARTWQRLGQAYISQGDTSAAVTAFQRVVDANPNDMEMRFGVAIMYQREGDFAQAKELVDYAVERNPTDLTALGLRAEICVEGELWDCALETLELVFDADSTSHTNEEFYQQLFGAAQSLGDTAAMLRWSGVAVDLLPESMVLWRARAQALRDAGQDQGALAAYRRIAALDTTDFRSTLSAAQIAVSWIVIDTAVVLDTSAILLADTLLQETLARNPSVGVNVAVQYLTTGSGLARAQHFGLAVPWLEHALANAGEQQGIVTQSNFWLGISYVPQIQELDGQAVDTQSCEIAEQEAELVMRGKSAMESGSEVHPPTAQQYLGFYAQFEQRVPTLREAFCQ